MSAGLRALPTTLQFGFPDCGEQKNCHSKHGQKSGPVCPLRCVAADGRELDELWALALLQTVIRHREIQSRRLRQSASEIRKKIRGVGQLKDCRGSDPQGSGPFFLDASGGAAFRSTPDHVSPRFWAIRIWRRDVAISRLSGDLLASAHSPQSSTEGGTAWRPPSTTLPGSNAI